MTNPPGVSWSRVTPGPASFGLAEMTGVAAAGSKVVVVGAERPGDDTDLDAAVWFAGRDD
ncbi:MAG: hypothetical protein O6951_00985 [Actinobacteria bacterium]|nr:hypothetical protein [Actinomycetota bacterium]